MAGFAGLVGFAGFAGCVRYRVLAADARRQPPTAIRRQLVVEMKPPTPWKQTAMPVLGLYFALQLSKLDSLSIARSLSGVDCRVESLKLVLTSGEANASVEIGPLYCTCTSNLSSLSTPKLWQA